MSGEREGRESKESNRSRGKWQRRGRESRKCGRGGKDAEERRWVKRREKEEERGGNEKDVEGERKGGKE